MLKTLPRLIEKSTLELHHPALKPTVKVVHFPDGVAVRFIGSFRTALNKAKGKDSQLSHVDGFFKTKANALIEILMGNWTFWDGQRYRSELQDFLNREVKRHEESDEMVTTGVYIYPEKPEKGEVDPLTPNNENIRIGMSATFTKEQWKEVKDKWRDKGFLRRNKIELKEVHI